MVSIALIAMGDVENGEPFGGKAPHDQNFHQSGFPGAVFSDDRVDLAGMKIQVDPLQKRFVLPTGVQAD